MKIKNHKLVGVRFEENPHHGGTITPQFIVQHYTAGFSVNGSLSAIINRGLSAHIFIGRNGEIIQTVPFNKKGFHAGSSSFEGFNGLNKNSIGIENANIGFLDIQNSDGSWTRPGLRRSFAPDEVIVARHKKGGRVKAWEKYTEDQLDAIETVTQTLIDHYSTIRTVVGHDDISHSGKVDPGPAFPMDRFQSLSRELQVDKETSDPLAQDNEGSWTVTASSLNLRGGPSTSFEILKSLKRGNIVTVLFPKDEWRAVDTDNDGEIDGFVHGDFLRKA
jgi:N-acetylmuramoyl-L-alanine amidase